MFGGKIAILTSKSPHKYNCNIELKITIIYFNQPACKMDFTELLYIITIYKYKNYCI